MDSAMLPSLRIGNTFTAKTEFRAQRNRAYGGGINLLSINGVLSTSPAIRGWADYGSGKVSTRFFYACQSKTWLQPAKSLTPCAGFMGTS